MTQEEISPNDIKKGTIWNKPKTPLMLQFEEETGRNAIKRGNKITGLFMYWLFKKGLKTSNFSEVNQTMSIAQKEIYNRPEVKEKHSKSMIEAWNKPGYRKNQSKKIEEVWNRPDYREHLSGKNHYLFGKIGDKHPRFKENAGYYANHMWIRRHFPQKEICDNKCEICGEFRLDLQLAQFIHLNRRNMEDPMIDYLYMCPKMKKDEICKNNCHNIYDKLSKKQKEELLNGAITREEKLNRVREYVLKIKN